MVVSVLSTMDVADARHVGLRETLDVHADVVARTGGLDRLVVHFDGEHLAGARGRGGVGRQEDDFVVRLDGALLDTAGEHITDTLDLVDARERGAHRRIGLAARGLDHVLERVVQGLDVELVVLVAEDNDVNALPPRHLLRLLDQVVAHPARDRDERNLLLDDGLLPADLLEHAHDFVTDFGVAGLTVLGNIAVHLVDADNDLLDTEKVVSSECWRVWPMTSPAFGLPLAMAVAKLPSAGTMMRATSACEAPVIMFLMKSR